MSKTDYLRSGILNLLEENKGKYFKTRVHVVAFRRNPYSARDTNKKGPSGSKEIKKPPLSNRENN